MLRLRLQRWGSNAYNIPIAIERTPDFGEIQCLLYLNELAQDMANDGEVLARITMQLPNEIEDLNPLSPLAELMDNKPEVVFLHFQRVGCGSWMACFTKVLKEVKEHPIASNQPMLPWYN